ncbi:NAD(P)H nitroreductase [Aestuariibacter sp. AA17]|uniref:Putative NAD(P)H nitroreductase n=1 Tax=Fluctibacter corallii TaxID=2984329 RepID=A0ABT3A7K1_9ALTE|nr:NAD(P)H nitroreductase [Aestuariibacter sp. AA17]MCV2884257.1 NAD(P)H nitroreductase [Aestuariibacter sp. AA17]
MDAISLLVNRHSCPKLEAPAPTGEALDIIKRAALRAPDHACLRPWQFVVCEGEGLTRLGDIYLDAAKKEHFSERDIERAPSLPLRAPMIIVAIAKFTEHEKVPWVEQVASASCAVQAMQMAALSQGFNGIWRTGPYARSETVKKAFNLQAEDEIVGFLYLGTPSVDVKPRRDIEHEAFFEHWA